MIAEIIPQKCLSAFVRSGVLASLVAAAAVVAAPPPPGFEALIAPGDLAGWHGRTSYDPAALAALPAAERDGLLLAWSKTMLGRTDRAGPSHWSVVDAELRHDGKGGDAATVREFGDIELLGEYRIGEGGAALIYLRGVAPLAFGAERNTPAPDGAVVELPGGKAGEWHSFRLRLVGSRGSVTIDGHPVLTHARLTRGAVGDRRPPLPRRGPVQLGSRGGAAAWRNLFVREIGGEEATRILQGEESGGYARIFNATDLSGWTGATEVATVSDGRLVWRAGQGGQLYWSQEVADFKVRLAFRLPPGGNNGLALRSPGSGNVAYSGMCELQILDENYATVKAPIDPRQVHGSAYGMVGALRGYQYPAGAWNFQEVTVVGSTVRVELNGNVILETDLAQADPGAFLDNKAHPGRLRRQGLFGFAGHGDAVEFRDIQLKKL